MPSSRPVAGLTGRIFTPLVRPRSIISAHHRKPQALTDHTDDRLIVYVAGPDLWSHAVFLKSGVDIQVELSVGHQKLLAVKVCNGKLSSP